MIPYSISTLWSPRTICMTPIPPPASIPTFANRCSRLEPFGCKKKIIDENMPVRKVYDINSVQDWFRYEFMYLAKGNDEIHQAYTKAYRRMRVNAGNPKSIGECVGIINCEPSSPIFAICNKRDNCLCGESAASGSSMIYNVWICSISRFTS